MCDKEEYYNDLIKKYVTLKTRDIIAKLPVIKRPLCLKKTENRTNEEVD